jgi:hypothetical protein
VLGTPRSLTSVSFAPHFHVADENGATIYSELVSLFEQFFALVEATVRLPPGSERRAAFRDVHHYGARIDQIAAQLLKQDRSGSPGSFL